MNLMRYRHAMARTNWTGCLLAVCFCLCASCADEATDDAPDAAPDTTPDVAADAVADAVDAAVEDGDAADDAEDAAPPPSTAMDWPTTPPAVPRLTSRQFAHAIHDLFGDDIVVPSNIEPDVETSGLLQIGAAAATISPRGVEKFEAAIYNIAAQAIDEEFVAAHACHKKALKLIKHRRVSFVKIATISSPS